MHSPLENNVSTEMTRARNKRTGLMLLAIVAIFFFGVMLKTKLMGL